MHLPQLRDQQCLLMEQVQLCYERIQYSHRVDLTHIPVMLLCGIGLFEVVLHTAYIKVMHFLA